MIRIDGNTYEVVTDYREGWNPEAFKDRYNEVLGKYDYIVGDWGYGQLRLKGFIEKDNSKNPKDNSIAILEEYIIEYCNFGCPHFVLKKMDKQDKLDKSLS